MLGEPEHRQHYRWQAASVRGNVVLLEHQSDGATCTVDDEIVGNSNAVGSFLLVEHAVQHILIDHQVVDGTHDHLS